MVYLRCCRRLAGVLVSRNPSSRLYHHLGSVTAVCHRNPLVNVQPRRTHIFEARDKDMAKKEEEITLSHAEVFEKLAKQKAKDKATFQTAVSMYLEHQRVQRRGMVEFVYASLKKMKDFGVHKDLAVYKQIIRLFPEEKMVAQSIWQKEMQHYPKQQQCMIDVLDQMEFHGVMPDDETGSLIVRIFGAETHPMRKYQRMMYWMPKFKYANPYYIPHQLPNDPFELAKMALKRMAVDLQNQIAVFKCSDYDNIVDDTYIVSAQSPMQRELIDKHPVDVPLYVEGAFLTWLREVPLNYFVLRGDRTTRHRIYKTEYKKQNEENYLKLDNIASMFEGPKKDLVEKPSVHEQEEGTIMGMAITGTGSKDSLATWIKALQEANPKLADIPIVFLLQSPGNAIQVCNDEDPMPPMAPIR